MPSAQVKVGVVGAGGRMGQEIAEILSRHKKLQAYAGFDPKKAAGFICSIKDLKAKEALLVDVWIDFSTPSSFEDVMDFAVKNKKPLVSGTTGLTEKNKSALKKASQQIPVLWASNMSLGIAVLNEALRHFAEISDFDFQVEEVHHKHKVDKPSGTALTLQENLEAAVGRKLPEPLAIRGGGVYGIHKIWAISDEEQLVFEHQALNRAVFARGAVRAAEWLANKKPGLYTIRDVLLDSDKKRGK